MRQRKANPSTCSRYLVPGFLFLLAVLLTAAPALSTTQGEIPPEGASSWEGSATTAKYYSNRTISLGIELNRDQARLVGFTLINRPYISPLDPAPVRPYRLEEPLQVDVTLLGTGERRYTQRVDAASLCFAHGPEQEAHVIGNLILVHRSTLIVEIPEISGFDRFEISFGDGKDKKVTSLVKLKKDMFISAGRPFQYEDLMFAEN